MNQIKQAKIINHIKQTKYYRVLNGRTYQKCKCNLMLMFKKNNK